MISTRIDRQGLERSRESMGNELVSTVTRNEELSQRIERLETTDERNKEVYYSCCFICLIGHVNAARVAKQLSDANVRREGGDGGGVCVAEVHAYATNGRA